MFRLSSAPLNRNELVAELANHGAGAIVVFEGWVRNHNQGKAVTALEYQVYEELALKEGTRILAEAKEKFNLHSAISVHRHGHLGLGEIAVWIGATASHRDDAFRASRYVIDEIKHRLPVWKKEHYVGEEPQWVFCKQHHHHVHFEEADFYKKQNALVSQDKLREAKVLVVGAGGLGCPALLGLTQAGVGSISIIDPDRVDVSNLHRQSLFGTSQVGEKKVTVAKQVLADMNPFIRIQSIPRLFQPEDVQGFDLVLDCTDNMATKFLIHDACMNARVPFLTAGIFRFEGQLRTIVPGSDHGCLRCHGGKTPDDSLLGNCNDFGVLGASVNVLGSLQALEAISLLTQGTTATLTHTLFLDLRSLTQLKVSNRKVTDCVSCAGAMDVAVDDFEVGFEKLREQGMAFLDIRDLSDDVVEGMVSDRPLVLCCHRGIRSRRVAQGLRARGHRHVYSLKGGATVL